MNYKPILIVAGEPNSIFLEIFFKSIQAHNYKSPLIIIASKKLLEQQMMKLGFFFKINTIDQNFKKFNLLDNKKINLINVEYKFKSCFEKISNKSNDYIKDSFELALKIIKQNKLSKLDHKTIRLGMKNLLILSIFLNSFIKSKLTNKSIK